MLLKQTAEPKREHNKFFCVWNALFLAGVIRLAEAPEKQAGAL